LSLKDKAEKYFRNVYHEKWRGSTMKAIVVSSYCAGYEQRKKEEKEDRENITYSINNYRAED